jgi:hypothetical protein
MKIFLIAAFGAFAQEILHAAELYQGHTIITFRNRIKDPIYWALAILVILVSAGISLVWYDGEALKPVGHLDARDLLLFGAGAPAIFKKAIAGICKRHAHGGSESLGAPRDLVERIRFYFNLS